MIPMPDIVVSLYHRLCSPYRRNWLRQQRERKSVPIASLFYHRIADHQLTPWTMTTQDFARQIDWLQANFELISVDEAVTRLARGQNSRPAVAITFDDGYADNMDFAMPYLVDRGIPCMYYVSNRQILNQQAFSHDRDLGHSLTPNSVRDLKQLVRWGIDIGAHTRTHLDLGKITDIEILREELAGGRSELMHLLGCPIDHFAFPYGQPHNISTLAIQVAAEVGFRSVAGAYGGYNFMGQPSFFLQRFHGDPSLPRVQNWMNFDPRFFSALPEDRWVQTWRQHARSKPEGRKVQAAEHSVLPSVVAGS